MTTLEIILTAIIWISYGVFAAYQTDRYSYYPQGLFSGDEEEIILAVIIIIFSPIVLISRAIIGIFKTYK